MTLRVAWNYIVSFKTIILYFKYFLWTGGKDNKVTTVVATPGHGPDLPLEITYTDTKVIGKKLL